MEPRADSGVSQSPTGSVEGRKTRRSTWATGFDTLAVVIAFAVLLTTTGRLPLAAIFPAGAPAVPTGWQLYRDPTGYFTVRIPSGWTAQRDTGQGTEGNSRTGQSASFTIYGTSLSMPPAGTSSITVGHHRRAIFKRLRAAMGLPEWVSRQHDRRRLARRSR
jgi:hypothetical protein